MVVYIVLNSGEFGVIYDLQVFETKGEARAYIRSRANPGDFRLESRNVRAETKIEKPKQYPIKLEDSEQYRMQMASISVAAMGYWKEGDEIHPDYNTPVLHDVAKLYAKYKELKTAATGDKA